MIDVPELDIYLKMHACIVEVVRNKAGVFVARGDGPSSRITALVRRREL